jgi:hypothetical protein
MKNMKMFNSLSFSITKQHEEEEDNDDPKFVVVF